MKQALCLAAHPRLAEGRRAVRGNPDTTVAVVLHRQGRLDLLGTYVKSVLLPPGVCAEWLAGDPTVEQALSSAGFLRVVAVTDHALQEQMRSLETADLNDANVASRFIEVKKSLRDAL
ncbi:hypothetical protein [uncultured Thiohalocapsa sp.]|uniref:hypothetical protein n=1 Tax=uncultured Thiohalocapsa sp. TaxID=768990 RepID=UPI0025FD18F1|nr:hypothetical protein [uncultured Thiohalocapsa sp.]